MAIGLARYESSDERPGNPAATAVSSTGRGAVVIDEAPIDAVFEGSNGEYYTDWEVDRRLRTGAWRPCLRQTDPDRRLVEVEAGVLLLLAPIDPEELPASMVLRVEDDSARVVDTRPPLPTGCSARALE
ncbi:hypothetical protein [Natronococcus pandeyae]|uniref:hypothetical protein n=1 Tax=Natronococcus pandeyae TaxID=2055836 RepID=UPI001F42D4DC|nr:hypothetical protein [Natronococcus pandeyae]